MSWLDRVNQEIEVAFESYWTPDGTLVVKNLNHDLQFALALAIWNSEEKPKERTNKNPGKKKQETKCKKKTSRISPIWKKVKILSKVFASTIQVLLVDD